MKENPGSKKINEDRIWDIMYPKIVLKSCRSFNYY